MHSSTGLGEGIKVDIRNDGAAGRRLLRQKTTNVRYTGEGEGAISLDLGLLLQ